MFKSIQWKIVVLYSLLILFAMQLIGVYIVQALERYYLNNFSANTEAQAELVSSLIERRLVEEADDAFISDILDGFIAQSQLEMKVIDRFGRLISGEHDSLLGGQRIVQEEINRALAGIRSEGFRRQSGNNQRYYYLAYPVKADQSVVGVVYLTGSLEAIDQTLYRVKMIFLSGSGLVIAVAVLLGFVLARTITSPIREVTQKAEKMARGDFTQRLKVQADDEIGQLAEMYNYLARRLSDTLQEISTEKNKVETILNYMSDGIIAFNKEGQVIHLNPAAHELLPDRQTGGEPGGMEILHSLLTPGELQQYMSSEKPVTREIVLEQEGKQRILRANFAPFRKGEPRENGNLSGMLVALQDITREREYARLQQEFVANVSHELRTPLTAIKSYVETLLMGASREPGLLHKFLSVVEKEAERMNNLVRDLLVLSQMDSRQVKWRAREVETNVLIQEVEEQFRLPAEEKGLVLINQSPALPAVIADRDRFKQVWINLVGNAIKYTPPGGRIALSAELAEDSIIFCVSDTGCGIPAQDRARVFERFYRVDKARSREHGGTGLGLSIAREIVEAHGGVIWIESQLARGTKVFFTLPLNSKGIERQ